VADAISGYLEETKLTKKPKTFAAYSTALAYFKESCHKQNVEDIDRRDMLKFSAFLRDVKGQSPRSAYNKFENVMALKAQGIQTQGVHGLVGKNDWPRFTEEERIGVTPRPLHRDRVEQGQLDAPALRRAQ
jgi:Phage integrase SAM-like domain